MTPNHPKTPEHDPSGPPKTDDESALESLGEAISEAVLGADENAPVPPAKPQTVAEPKPVAPGKPGESRQPR